jgi:T-complex protein 1 subunit delta
MAVDAVLNVIDPGRPNSVDLKDIKVLKKLGGTVCECSL